MKIIIDRKALQTILDSSEKEFYELSEPHRESIEAGRKDIKNGHFKSHEQVMEEMTAWLKNNVCCRLPQPR